MGFVGGGGDEPTVIFDMEDSLPEESGDSFGEDLCALS